MPLPAPDLDDRRFQDLVDEAKRMVQQRCPEWTDHNVSDPGVTLIELFAWMTEQVVYRLNRVPDKLYTTFLNLLGVSTYPASAASVQQTFWLSAPQPAPIVLPSGTQVATPRVPGADPIVFTTTQELVMPSVELMHVRAAPAEGSSRDLGPQLRRGDGAAIYSELPAVGDALLLGLSVPAPSCVVTLFLDCSVRGVGVDPDDPPVVWEAFNGDTWTPCELEDDTTRAFNQPGTVLLHVPDDHRSATIGRAKGGWLRARLVPARPGQPDYSEPPVLRDAAADVTGGTVRAVHAERVLDEVVGTCLGLPGERMHLQRSPLVPGDEPAVVEVAEPDATGVTAWVPWQVVPDFGDSVASSRHVTLDSRSGELAFGPAVREAGGGLRRYGQVPPQGAAVRVREYRTGGGAAGNVSANALVVLTSSLPYVSSVTNRRPASGGRDAESLEHAKTRGPVALRHRGRAVTVEDFETLALEAAPEVARVRAVAAGDGADAGGVRVLVVPSVSAPDGRLEFGQMVPAVATLRRIAESLDAVRVLATRLVVEPPTYQGITVIARLRATPGAAPTAVEAEVLAALHHWFDPVSGGPTGDGWPFGRTAHVGEVYGVLQRVPGVDLVEAVRLYAADPVENVRGKAAQRIELDPHALVFSFDHQVKVLPSWHEGP